MAAKPVMVSDGADNFLKSWDRDGSGFDWSQQPEHGIHQFSIALVAMSAIRQRACILLGRKDCARTKAHWESSVQTLFWNQLEPLVFDAEDVLNSN